MFNGLLCQINIDYSKSFQQLCFLLFIQDKFGEHPKSTQLISFVWILNDKQIIKYWDCVSPIDSLI